MSASYPSSNYAENKHPTLAATLVRAMSEVLHWVRIKIRWLVFNATIFIFHRAAPWSTVFYGRILLLHRPVRIAFGRRCHVGDSVYLATSRISNITLGDDVTVNLGCVFVSMASIRIGARTAIAEYVSIRDQAHHHAPGQGVRGQGYKIAPIEIGENVWIGRGAFIGPGTRIGNNCIIGANSVVHGEFPSNVLIAGAPAIVKKALGYGNPPQVAHVETP